MPALHLNPLLHFPLIRPGDNLADLIARALPANNMVLQHADILVLAQKIVSKAEGRTVNLAGIQPSPRARELAQLSEKDPRLVELILQESREVLRTRPGTLIVEHRLGFVCANAGIDHSNVTSPRPEAERQAPGSSSLEDEDDWVLLLPEDPDRSADRIRRDLESGSGKRIGVLVIDSHGRAWRNGTVGAAIGIAGIPGLQDLRGEPDLFGSTLRITQVGVADELAAAASLVMGQAAEGTPVVHVRGFPYPLREGSMQELLRPKEQDLFR